MTHPALPSLIAERYEVIRTLGRGSFAQTLLARDTRDNRHVALKVLHPRVVSDWKSFELFEREATVLRGLRHHGVPEIYEHFRAPHDGADAAFIAMEYVEGVSLAQHIAERRHLGPEEVVQLFVEMLGVLEYLHTRLPPILHRDIKPANILIRSDGTPVLVDFGAVRNAFRDATEDGSTMVGTHGYMPFEQLMGRATPSSDLYALAATVLHLITGRAPSGFLNDEGVLRVPADLPGGTALRGVISRMLAHAPAERFISARAARAALLGSGIAGAAQALAAPALATGNAMLVAIPEGKTASEMASTVSYSALDLLAPDEKETGGITVSDRVVIGLLSVATLGIMPAVFFFMARRRRRRLQHFFEHGTPALARIRAMEREEIAFRSFLTRVRYEFEAGGTVRRASDLVLPAVADAWGVGDTMQVLYIADETYDSVIVSIE